MHLTIHTDYALRLLMYLAIADREVTTAEVADKYKISQNHLVKVAQHLAELGLIHTRRGRSGGLRLAKSPDEMSLGQLVQETEPHTNLVECFDAERNQCVVTPACQLQGILMRARRAFFQELDRYTLADVLHNVEGLRATLGITVLEEKADA